jgi:hypothetical protein
LEFSFLEEEISADREGLCVDGLGELGGARMVVHAYTAEIRAEPRLHVRASRLREGASTRCPFDTQLCVEAARRSA